MSVVEKIKQIFERLVETIGFNDAIQGEIASRRDDVLKILSGYTIIEKQKIQEKLMRLMCLRAGSIYYADEENGMKLLLVELLTGRKLKNRRQIDAFLNISRCKSLDEARAKLDLFGVESTKKETTTQEEDIESEKEFEKWEKESKP